MGKIYVLPEKLNKRLISSMMSSAFKKDDDNGFSLKCSKDFANRSGGIFGKLNDLEKDHDVWVSENKTLNFEEPENNFNREKLSESVKSDRNERHVKCRKTQVVFRKPFPVSQKKRRTISKVSKSPRKWTKYSLEDVSLSSDSTNRAVALEFIDELRSRKLSPKTDGTDSGKIVFSKPTLKKSKTDVSSSEDFSGSTSKSEKGNSAVKLSHLEEGNLDSD